MQVTTVLNVSANYLFTRLVEPWLYDIEQQTHSHMHANDLTGFSYRAKLVNHSAMKIKFTRVLPATTLHYETQQGFNRVAIKYDLTPLNANQVAVRYVEEDLTERPTHWRRLGKWVSDELKSRNLKKQLKFYETGY